MRSDGPALSVNNVIERNKLAFLAQSTRDMGGLSFIGAGHSGNIVRYVVSSWMFFFFFFFWCWKDRPFPPSEHGMCLFARECKQRRFVCVPCKQVHSLTYDPEAFQLVHPAQPV
jgi:hypothetical protein